MPVKIPLIHADQMYTMAEACELIPGREGRPLTPQTLRGWLKGGKLTGRKIGGTQYIDGAAIKRVLDGVDR